GASFGGQADGADTTTYLTSGGPNGSTTLTFGTQQKYLGLLWGSVDDYNTLEFFSGGVSVATFQGLDVSNSTGTGNCIGGDQGALGTCYVNINFLSQSFDEVVATSDAYAFEFDNVAFSMAPVGVPEPRILAMFGLGLLLVGSAYRFKGRRAG
ncbi:MAG: Npun_F0296 family exosortase-dependent surface protein, partial [Burkholderiales bacterium]